MLSAQMHRRASPPRRTSCRYPTSTLVGTLSRGSGPRNLACRGRLCVLVRRSSGEGVATPDNSPRRFAMCQGGIPLSLPGNGMLPFLGQLRFHFGVFGMLSKRRKRSKYQGRNSDLAPKPRRTLQQEALADLAHHDEAALGHRDAGTHDPQPGRRAWSAAGWSPPLAQRPKAPAAGSPAR